MSIIRAVISLAHNLRLANVAEGVESRDQADFLRVEGCDFCQGLYFGRPAGADAAVSRLVGEKSVAAAFPSDLFVFTPIKTED